MTDILMPRLSDTMEEGVVSSWSINIGDQVKKGDVVGEIETDKTTMEMEAYDEGVLEKFLVSEGDTVQIGEPIARLSDGSATEQEHEASDSKDEQADSDEQAGSKPSAPQGADQDARQARASGPEPAQEPARAADDSDVRGSPLAKRMAREHDIDLTTLTGTGPDGRIIRTDVERAVAEQGKPEPQAPEQKPSAPAAGDEDTEVKLNATQRVTAERLSANVDAPVFQETVSVRVDDLLAFRKDLNSRLDSGKVSVNDLFVKACATTLAAHPEVNSSWGGDKIIRKGSVNVGIAVAIPAGLIVPVVKNADRKSLTAISAEAVDLAGRAKNGKLKPDEFQGGTFSISNLGMFGIDDFTALINPPEAAILAVGAANEEPVVKAGSLSTKSVIKLTMSVDHRVVNGAEAARFLSDLRANIEDPLRIVV